MDFTFPYPYFPVQFTKEGTVFRQTDVDALMNGLQPGLTDLFVLSHGWNNNMDDAQSLYSGLMAQVAAQVAAAPSLAGRTFAICGILWPSKKFDEADLIPSGAASLNDAVTTAQVQSRIEDLADLIQAKGWPMEAPDSGVADTLKAVLDSVGDWEDDPTVRTTMVNSIRGLLPAASAGPEDASDRFFELSADQLIANLSRSLSPAQSVAQTGAMSLEVSDDDTASGTGGAASLSDLVGGIQASLWHYLNFTTYYMMKARAGDVGVNGVRPLIDSIRAAHPNLRLHLIGHSFGCRVVSAAVNALQSGQSWPNTMTLLEGAFSHYGFAAKWDGANDGLFRSVIAQKKVRGPILITHTWNDKAVGVAYPLASRIAGQIAASLGDENDPYGGLGSNGAQNDSTCPERVVGTLLDVGGAYPFAVGPTSSKLYNLKADAYIGGHSDIVKPQVGYAVAVAMASPDAV